MKGFKQLSMLTKITFGLVCVFMLILCLGFFPWTHKWGALGVFMLGTIAVAAVLDDPEAEERIPLGLRILVGIGAALPFTLLTWLFQRMFPLGEFMFSKMKP